MLPITVATSAAVQIRQVAEWWRKNRPAAPDAFREDLARAFEIIAHQSGIGARATNVRLKNVRRIHLSRLRYYLYYRVCATHIEILALWHDSRGESPNL